MIYYWSKNWKPLKYLNELSIIYKGHSKYAQRVSLYMQRASLVCAKDLPSIYKEPPYALQIN